MTGRCTTTSASALLRVRGGSRGSSASARPAVLRCLARCAHAARIELALIVFLYLVYQVGRGVVGDAFDQAQLHAQEIFALERSLGVFWEAGLQEGVGSVPGLATLLALSYMSLHVGATTAVLVWLYRRHPASYALARTRLIVGTAIALAIHVAFRPRRPAWPRLGSGTWWRPRGAWISAPIW